MVRANQRRKSSQGSCCCNAGLQVAGRSLLPDRYTRLGLTSRLDQLLQGMLPLPMRKAWLDLARAALQG